MAATTSTSMKLRILALFARLSMKTPVSSAPQKLLIPTALALLFAMNSHAAADRTVYDFQTATKAAAWQVVNDDVMGGVSTSSFRLTNGVALFQGKVSLENSGGFASARSLPANHDLAGGDTFVVRVRGDGRRYKFTARTDPSFDNVIYQCVFATKKGEWEERRLPFKQFVATFRGRVLSSEPPLEAAKVISVGFLISDKQDGPFQLEVAWIKVALPPGQ
jgi:monofunctional biosynthetic peptidoglycan transglycosylase